MIKVRVDAEKCIGCGACVNSCPSSLYSLNGNNKPKIVGDLEGCILCRACETSCPVGAITIIT